MQTIQRFLLTALSALPIVACSAGRCTIPIK